VSNWLHENVAEGDEIELTRPAGVFCLRETDVPLLGFSGGSGITPILSLAKSALAATGRQVRLLCADRDRQSMIFNEALNELGRRFPGRLSVVRHLDAEQGLIDTTAVKEFIGTDGEADNYICGPEPFMDIVESALPGPGQMFIERFGDTAAPNTEPGQALEGEVTIILGRKRASVPRHAGETLLESARRAGLTPPFSCEAGNCATCIATVTEGSVTMRVNDALTEEEVAEGYVLTCQSVPDTPSVTVRYE
jgi:ferredoxin-NADP reductase